MYIGVCLPDARHHVTVTFNGHNETKQDFLLAVHSLSAAALTWNEIDGREIWMAFNGLHIFDPPGVWVELVKSKTLGRFREFLTGELTARDVYWSDDFDFVPHVTLSYFKKPRVAPYEDQHMRVTKFTVVSDEFGKTEVPV